MKQRLLSMRPAVTRLNRRDARGAQLESVAAEFALLAQRRARLTRQLDLLDRQLQAAAGSMTLVQARMGQLAQRMDQIDPGLRPAADIQELVQAASAFQTARKMGASRGWKEAPQPAVPRTQSLSDPPRDKPAQAGQENRARSGAAAPPILRRPLPPRRRPFLPE